MKKFVLALAIASMVSLPVVGATNYWNGDANYPEITNTEAYLPHNAGQSYYFDQGSLFKGIDSSRNFVFGLNVVTMYNNQYGSPNLYKYVVIPGMNIVCRYDAADKPHQIDASSPEWPIFLQARKLAYGVDFH